MLPVFKTYWYGQTLTGLMERPQDAASNSMGSRPDLEEFFNLPCCTCYRKCPIVAVRARRCSCVTQRPAHASLSPGAGRGPPARRWSTRPVVCCRHQAKRNHTIQFTAYMSAYSSSSSSNSPSSSAVASWYCWYSETRSFMLDSASVNSISSMPSPVYQ